MQELLRKRWIRFRQNVKDSMLKAMRDGEALISPLEGEMAGRPEGGAKDLGAHPLARRPLGV